MKTSYTRIVLNQTANPKHVVSVGLGSSTRDSYLETELLGEPIIIERRGTDGDIKAAAKMLRELDGKVDAFGLGGIVLFIQAAGKRCFLRDALKLAQNAKQTPTNSRTRGDVCA